MADTGQDDTSQGVVSTQDVSSQGVMSTEEHTESPNVTSELEIVSDQNDTQNLGVNSIQHDTRTNTSQQPTRESNNKKQMEEQTNCNKPNYQVTEQNTQETEQKEHCKSIISQNSMDEDAMMSESLLKDDSVIVFDKRREGGEERENSEKEIEKEGEYDNGSEEIDEEQMHNERDNDEENENKNKQYINKEEQNKQINNEHDNEKENEIDKLSDFSQGSEVTKPNLLTDIEDLLTSSSPDSGFEVSKVDINSTSKDYLMKMISSLLDECNTLKQEKTRLEGEVDRLEADQSSSVYATQIEALERSLAQAQADACSWQLKVQQTEEKYLAENIKIRTDLTARLERLTKQYESANKDKESMVIKYATSEREVIVARQQKEAVEKKMRDMEKEREQLLTKNKNLIADRARVCQNLDAKVQKNNMYQREVERLREEVSSREVKIKWAQNKLKAELDTHKETQAKLDRALTKIMKHEEELRSIKDEAEKVVRDTRTDENSRANVLDKQLQEEKARLIMERQVNEDRGSVFTRVSSEYEALKTRHKEAQEELVSLRAKAATFESEREESEKLFTSLRCEVTSARQQVADLNHQLSTSHHLHDQLSREQEQLSAALGENERLQAFNNDLQAEMLTCRQKEAELLAFTQKLTDKNVQIQSQLSAIQAKTQLLEEEQGEMRSELDGVRSSKARMEADLTRRHDANTAEIDGLKQQLSSKVEELKQQTTKALDLENEIQVMKRKHTNAQKDLSREMQKLRRRLEMHETGGVAGGMGVSGGMGGEGGMSGRSSQSVTPHDALSQASRTSSNTSLHAMDYNHTNGSAAAESISDPIVTQQLLVERIVKLQKQAARKHEKIEFLEEHVAQLVGELKKKSRLIHHYVMKEEVGALANSASDTNKAELMRHGGIMASLYGSSARDDTMTLDLSLEINRKLQAVLEDTLLKNITLKENLNTLGDEIAKISLQNQQVDARK